METFVSVFVLRGTPQSSFQHPRKRSVSKQGYKDRGGSYLLYLHLSFSFFPSRRSIPVTAEEKKKKKKR